MEIVNQEFESAPMGGRVVRTTALVFVFVGLVVVGEAFFGFKAYHGPTGPVARLWPAVVAPIVAITVMLGKFYYERSTTARFRIEQNILVLGKKRYALARLTDAARNPDLMRWALRTRGNGGLGSIRGRFWSRRMGSFEAFLTGTENAVVLRWPTAVVAVSPADPEFFILMARKAAELP